MFIKELFHKKEVVVSFEVFPPKNTTPIDTIYRTVDELACLKPDYISVTYGAGGSSRENRTVELSSLVKNKYNIEALAHLTCINSKAEEINKVLDMLSYNGITNILALRGDLREGEVNSGDFKNASELIYYIKNHGGFNVSAACYPEGYIKDGNLEKDLLVMKSKVEAGADEFISQLFFDNNYFYNFLSKMRENNIDVPVQAGIMPVINKRQMERVLSLCGATLPHKFIKIMNKYEHHEKALVDAGICYATNQIIDLISSGIRGIHIYTMNNPYVAKKIMENLKAIISSINLKENIL